MASITVPEGSLGHVPGHSGDRDRDGGGDRDQAATRCELEAPGDVHSDFVRLQRSGGPLPHMSDSERRALAQSLLDKLMGRGK